MSTKEPHASQPITSKHFQCKHDENSGRSSLFHSDFLSNFDTLFTLFPDWLKENDMSQTFEDLPGEDLSQLLRQFYGTVLSKNHKEYSKSGLINLHSGINCYLRAPPFSKTLDLMNDRIFTQANLVLTGRMRHNKDKGLDTTTPRIALEKEHLEKLFTEYFPKAVGDTINTEVLLHKVFFDIMYYTGQRGKEGLRKLSKNSFQIKNGPNGEQYIEITFNEKTKKNQGDAMSAKSNMLHNDHHIITEIKNSPLCPVSSFEMYLDLLNPDSTAFFQYPNKKKTGFTKEVIRKNPLGNMMKEISKEAKLNRTYTNHQIRRTTVTGMKRSGFSLEQISHVTKHKNLDSLKHYADAPTFTEKKSYNDGLFNYGKKTDTPPQKKLNYESQGTVNNMEQENFNQKLQNNSQVALANREVNTLPPSAVPDRTDLCSIVNNQLRQAPNLFQNANFSNCNFNFTLPQ